MKKTCVEVNGPATIIMLLEHMDRRNLTGEQVGYLNAIMDTAQRTMKYIKKLDNPKNVQWHKIEGKRD